MTIDQQLREEAPPLGQVEAWAVARMTQLGVSQEDAVELALAGISWHEVARLVDRGCPPALVVRVL